MRIGIAADHGGFHLKEKICAYLESAGHSVTDFGPHIYDAEDDYPDFIVPLARAVADGEVERGVAVCGSGIGACVASNKVEGVRAATIFDTFSARQGVEDDHMNIICLGGRIVGPSLALELIKTFLAARFSGAERHLRRLSKVKNLLSKDGI